jgi:hypothetical protein
MVNRQAGAITGMLRTTPVGPLIKEAGFYPAVLLLERRQRQYPLSVLGLPRGHTAIEVLPISFREGDQHAQPGKQPLENLAWVERPRGRGPWSLDQHLEVKLASILNIDPSASFEQVVRTCSKAFPGTILVPTQEKFITQAKAPYEGLSIWLDGSRLENGRTGAGVAWQDYSGAWECRKIPLGQVKEVFNAELIGVYKALEIA